MMDAKKYEELVNKAILELLGSEKHFTSDMMYKKMGELIKEIREEENLFNGLKVSIKRKVIIIKNRDDLSQLQLLPFLVDKLAGGECYLLYFLMDDTHITLLGGATFTDTREQSPNNIGYYVDFKKIVPYGVFQLNINEYRRFE